MVRIFHFGSCRTTLTLFNNDDYYFQKNYDLTYASKEIFTYLDLFDGIKTMDDLSYPECLMYYPEKFPALKYKNFLNESDIVLVEISTWKVVHQNNVYYQHNRARQNPKEIMVSYKQTREEIINDIELLNWRIKKPIIFLGHMDLNFYDIPDIYGHIVERQDLDDIIRNNCKNHVIIGDLFSGQDYKNICDFKLKPNDTQHITNDAKKVIYDAIIEKIKNL
jgi:hypothetical protein